jgi:hypothetical protein
MLQTERFHLNWLVRLVSDNSTVSDINLVLSSQRSIVCGEMFIMLCFGIFQDRFNRFEIHTHTTKNNIKNQINQLKFRIQPIYPRMPEQAPVTVRPSSVRDIPEIPFRVVSSDLGKAPAFGSFAAAAVKDESGTGIGVETLQWLTTAGNIECDQGGDLTPARGPVTRGTSWAGAGHWRFRAEPPTPKERAATKPKTPSRLGHSVCKPPMY